MKIKLFVFNPVQVNTYVAYDDTKECVIIDPGCCNDQESGILKKFISENSLVPKMAVATHFHFDHLMGAADVCSHYNIPLAGHKKYIFWWEIGMLEQAQSFGFSMKEPPEPTILLEQGSTLQFGNTTFKAIDCPGHSPCSIALYHQESFTLFSGDVLFNMSIGRTDLPGGDFDQIIDSIKKRFFTLPEEVTVYPGHGESTTVGAEKRGNPFF
jgi:hydroxyacylglutathione hydrolase